MATWRSACLRPHGSLVRDFDTHEFHGSPFCQYLLRGHGASTSFPLSGHAHSCVFKMNVKMNARIGLIQTPCPLEHEGYLVSNNDLPVSADHGNHFDLRPALERAVGPKNREFSKLQREYFESNYLPCDPATKSCPSHGYNRVFTPNSPTGDFGLLWFNPSPNGQRAVGRHIPRSTAIRRM